jgi:O-antigen/teichoic acid export membrane protein
MLASPFLLSLFGHDFTAHAYLTAILAVGFVAKGIVGPAELFLNVLGQQRACALVLMAAATLNITLNIVLIPSAGFAAAASFAVLALAFFLIARCRLGITLAPTIPSSTLGRIWPRLATNHEV